LPYASAILASASSASSGNFTELMQGQGQGQGQNQGQNGISGGGVAGLVIGILAALGLIALATLVYIRRSRKQAQAQANQRMSIIDIKPNPKLQEKRKPSIVQAKKVTLPTPIRK